MTTCQYRRTKAGEWVVQGPVNVVTVGARVTVAKKDGRTREEVITSIGRPFTVDGVSMVYGHTGHGWAKSGPYTRDDGPKDEAKEIVQSPPSGVCHLCFKTVDTSTLGVAWCDGEVIGCAEHGKGDECLACLECRGE